MYCIPKKLSMYVLRPNFKNLSRDLNLRRSSNRVSSTEKCMFGGFETRLKFIKFGLKRVLKIWKDIFIVYDFYKVNILIFLKYKTAFKYSVHVQQLRSFL